MEIETTPLQVMLKGLKAKQLIDSKFLGLLEKEFETSKVVNIQIITGEEENMDLLSIGYPRKVYEEKDELIVDVNNPENLEKILKVLNEYLSE